MRIAISIVRHILRAVLAAAAVANLAALFLFSYKLPDPIQGKIDDLRSGTGGGRIETLIGAISGESESEGQETEASGQTPAGQTPIAQMNARLVVPSMAMNYNGGDLDLLSGVYIQYSDGSRVEDMEVSTRIEDGNTRLDKVVYYSTTLEDGTELSASRPIRIGSRYTGPSLVVTGEIPEVSPEDNYRKVVREQIKAGNVYAEDGFGNDITDQVRGRMDRDTNEEGETTYRFVLYVTNAVGDTAEEAVTDEMLTTGVVCKLVTNELTLECGTPFYFTDYVAECHDSHGNSLSPQVSGIVNSYVYGDYEIQIWCTDENGVSSPQQTLRVHIV